MTAEDRLVWLIRSLDDARQTYSTASTGGGVRLMPSDYHRGSYRELERVLVDMRENGRRVEWWHVNHRYRFGETVTVEVPVVRSRQGARPILPARCELVVGQPVVGGTTARVRVYRWDERVDMGRVRAGVRWIKRAMYGGRKERIVLPDELYRRVVGLPPRQA